MLLNTAVVALRLASGAAAMPALSARGTTPSTAECAQIDQTYLDNLVCPDLQNLGGALFFQSDNINTQADAILKGVESIVSSGGDSDPTGIVSGILEDIGTGLASNLLYSVSSTLYAFGDAFEEADPDCQCNTIACFNAIDNARGDTSAGTSTATAACAEGRYRCAKFFTDDQYNQLSGCTDYTGTTSD